MKPNFLQDLRVGFRFAVTQPPHTTVSHVSSLIEITIDFASLATQTPHVTVFYVSILIKLTKTGRF